MGTGTPDRTRRTRRAVLAAGVGGLAALAGCASGGGDGEPESGGERGETRLVGLRVVNNDDSDHAVSVQVERNGAVAHWRTYDLGARTADGDNSASVATDWPAGAAAFAVEVRVDDAYRTFAVDGGGCQSVLIEVDDEGRPQVYTGERACPGDGNGNDSESGDA